MLGALFNKLTKDSTKRFRTYVGDTAFLNAAAAAAANVIAADGKIEEAEIKKAKRVMGENVIIKPSFDQRAIEKALEEALDRAETRSGKKQNSILIEAIRDTRDLEDREAIFLIGVDVGDVGEIGDEEDAVLTKLALQLGVDKGKLID